MYFVNDDSKEHYLIDDAETAQVCKQNRGEFKLEPCRKHDVIAVDSDDTFPKSLFFRDVRIQSLFHSVMLMSRELMNSMLMMNMIVRMPLI